MKKDLHLNFDINSYIFTNSIHFFEKGLKIKKGFQKKS